jgi:ribonucleoside-diphosphate reductase alpha chain
MFVKKRNGQLEEVDLNKIVNSLTRVSSDLKDLDIFKVATKTVGSLVDGVASREIDLISIKNSSNLAITDPQYGTLAARILSNYIAKELAVQDIHSFSQSIQTGYELGLINEATYKLVSANKRKLNSAIKPERDNLLEYHGIQTLYDRYCLKHTSAKVSENSKQRVVIETPQYFFMRVAAGLAETASEVIEMYNLLSSLEYMTSSPTLFNSGTQRSQMSSCYLLDSALDDLKDISKRQSDFNQLSKYAGGIGYSASRIRSSGSFIKGTNGNSNGLIPWLHANNGYVAAVNQGGKRKGAACVYIETHHADIMEFLELRDNAGEKEKRAYNLNLAVWVSDLFMKRMVANEQWSLFDPAVAPELNDLYGEAYEARYLELEREGKYAEQIPAHKLYARMIRTLSETGNGWICFKDTANKRGNQVHPETEVIQIELTNGSFLRHLPTDQIETISGTKYAAEITTADSIGVAGHSEVYGVKLVEKKLSSGIIHLSNLCTEILEITNSGKKIELTREQFNAMSPEKILHDNINILGYDHSTDRYTALEGHEVAVCNLGSINVGRNYVKNNKLDKEKLRKNVDIAVKYLDRVIDRNFYPIPESEASNKRWRPVGLGLMGLADIFYQLRLPYESDEAVALSATIQEEIYYQALKTSCELAKKHGAHRDFFLTRAAKGDLQFDLVGVEPSDKARWDALKADIKTYGLRNSLLIAIAPTASIAHISGAEECTEPTKSNLLKRETLSGEFISINKHLVADLKAIGRWNDETIQTLIQDEGSIMNLKNLPTDFYSLYKTVWEISQKAIIRHAAARGAFICQAQSTNIFLDLNKYDQNKRIGVLSALYKMAWESGLKTTYYLRSRSASRIQKVTVNNYDAAPTVAPENPEICESCT